MSSDNHNKKSEPELAEAAAQCPAKTGNSTNFIEEVKARSNPDRPELLQQFLAVFMEFYGGAKMPQASEAVPPIHEKMKEIFKDDPDLLEKFETFMPPGPIENLAS